MPLTTVTRRAIIRDLARLSIWWGGDLEDPEFLERLHPLGDLPSTDSRYSDALGDILQHRVANYDWDDDWVFGDSRFKLDTDDDRFLDFLAETAHPEVRSDVEEAARIVAVYNNNLKHDGFEIFHKQSISGRPVYGWRVIRPTSISPRQLRDAISEAVRDGFKSYEVEDFCVGIGLDPAVDQWDDPHKSKRTYVLRRIASKNTGELLALARRVLEETADRELSRVLGVFDAEGEAGVSGAVKNIIFAADGPKPEIVLDDAINNDIRITKNEQHCLVYDRPVDDGGLSWKALVAWWATTMPDADEREVALSLHRRLRASLNEGPEQLILATYAKLYGQYGFSIPALVPQVYLHYDPYRRGQSSARPLARQRMDFLFLFSRGRRVVIELDGKHHYADGDLAVPRLYAEMVKEDRTLRLAGYDVYRIGGYELMDPIPGEAMLVEFFRQLLDRYEVTLPTPNSSPGRGPK
jgi:AbiJ N-terminal domain 3